MKEVYEFLTKNRIFYVATIDRNKPRVRPFGALNIFEGKLYIMTGKSKDVSNQIQENNNIEITSATDDTWIRIEAKAIRDERREAKKSMLDNNPYLRGMYSEDDGNMEVLYLKDAKATINSFVKEAQIYEF